MFASRDLLNAISQLAKAGMAFTSSEGSNGETTYIVDSVSLAEDEIILLYKRGALTRDGIRHYLVSRAA